MKKDKFQEQYLSDFEKMRGALLAQIANNSKIDESLIEQFSKNDFSLLEEHTLISKIILDSTKTLSEAYKLAPGVINSIQDSKGETKEKINLDALLDD